MVATSTLLQLLALAPASALAARLSARDNSTFDLSELTLREVGSRNTLVRNPIAPDEEDKDLLM